MQPCLPSCNYIHGSTALAVLSSVRRNSPSHYQYCKHNFACIAIYLQGGAGGSLLLQKLSNKERDYIVKELLLYHQVTSERLRGLSKMTRALPTARQASSSSVAPDVDGIDASSSPTPSFKRQSTSTKKMGWFFAKMEMCRTCPSKRGQGKAGPCCQWSPKAWDVRVACRCATHTESPPLARGAASRVKQRGMEWPPPASIQVSVRKSERKRSDVADKH